MDWQKYNHNVLALDAVKQLQQEVQQKTDEQLKETDRKLQKVSDLLGGFGQNQGHVTDLRSYCY